MKSKRKNNTGFRAFLRRACRFVFLGVPERRTSVTVAQIRHGALLAGRRILVTGGTRGLGAEFVRKFLSEGASVVFTGSRRESVDAALAALGETGAGRVFGLPADARDATGAPALVAEAEKLLGGPPDSLVANAGVSLHESSWTVVSEENWDVQLDTNLKGTYFLAQAFAKRLLAARAATPASLPPGCAKILFLASERGLYGDDIPYGLTKAAIVSLTQGLAKSLVGSGVRVNAIAPGVVATDMTGYDPDGDLTRPQARGKRVLLAEEIAEVAAFLLSDAANCISGQVLACNETNHLR